MDIERIVAELEQERDRISQAIASLKGITLLAVPEGARLEKVGRRATVRWHEPNRQKATIGDDEEALG